ncbi:hypothetical protein EV651_119108 [Kribbella sp. VKM Ac-2571]|nr:hypothetical protein EV651_119108 [Kribbella sp. VKM Ac-2571]
MTDPLWWFAEQNCQPVTKMFRKGRASGSGRIGRPRIRTHRITDSRAPLVGDQCGCRQLQRIGSGRRTSGSRDRRVPGPPGRGTAGCRDRRVAGPPGAGTAGSRDPRVPGAPGGGGSARWRWFGEDFVPMWAGDPPQIRLPGGVAGGGAVARQRGVVLAAWRSGLVRVGQTSSSSPWALMARSGWWRSKAGDSERIRGSFSKLWRGGGQLVAHSSERPQPHGSSTSTRGVRRDL